MNNTQYIVGASVFVGALMLSVFLTIRGRPATWLWRFGPALLFLASGLLLLGNSLSWLAFAFVLIEIVSLVVSRARDARKAPAE